MQRRWLGCPPPCGHDRSAEKDEEEEEEQEQQPPTAVVTKIAAKSELLIFNDSCLKLPHALDLSTWYAKGLIRAPWGRASAQPHC